MRINLKKEEEQKLEVGDVIEAKIYNLAKDEIETIRYIVVKSGSLEGKAFELKERFTLISLEDMRVTLTRDNLKEIIEFFGNKCIFTVGEIVYYRIIKSENLELKEV